MRQVLQDCRSTDRIDLICPSCSAVVRDDYRGKKQNCHIRCNSCGAELEAFYIIVVKHGDEPPGVRRCHDILRRYWETATLYVPPERIDRAVREIGMHYNVEY